MNDFDTASKGDLPSVAVSTDRPLMDAAPDSDVTFVLGMTVASNSALTSNPISGVIAYPAGSVLILLNCVKNKQSSCIICPGKKITALNFSPDGQLLLIGETGHRAVVRVWRMDVMQEVANFGQFTGIECVAFTPSMQEIVVVGNAQDMVISVWSWPGKTMLSLNKFSDNVCAMSVSHDGSFFVTLSHRHLKFYCMDFSKEQFSTIPVPLTTKIMVNDILADGCPCDVVCGSSPEKSIFAISSSGILCQINNHRQVERWTCVNCVGRASCLTINNDHLFVGCSEGLIKMFTTSDLQLVTTLPRSHCLGTDISQHADRSRAGENSLHYPGVKAMEYDQIHDSLAVIYDDCSIYVWNRKSLLQFTKGYSSLFHRGCIWDFTIYPLPRHENPFSEEPQGGALPPGSLITVSADGTLRSWDVSSDISVDSTLKRNSVSSACLKIVYANTMKGYFENKEGNTKNGGRQHNTNLVPSPSRGHNIKPCLAKEGRDVLSVVTVCPEGHHIATGNRRGQLCVYDAYTMDTMTVMVAHEAEVTVITYTISSKYKILASGSRDRMIHLMDASNQYQLMSTLDDHSSTITAIHFTYASSYAIMVSSSLDMSVLARTYINDKSLSFSHVRAIAEKKAVVDFTLHPWTGQIALVCQDKMVHVKSITCSRDGYSFRGCSPDGGQLVKIIADPSGLYLLTACTKKNICLIKFESGEILKTFSGHADSVTRVQFSLNMKFIISSSSDGCIFFWKLPLTVAYSVKLVMAEMGLLTRGMVLGEQWKKSPPCLRRMRALDRMTSTKCVERRSTSPKIRQSTSCCIMPEDKLGNEIRSVKSDSLLPSEIWSSREYNIMVKDRIDCLDDYNRILGEDAKLPPPERRSSSANDSWMSTCCRRRELFKLEAKSIKRVLVMMRMLADAMEKDLQEEKNGGIVGASLRNSVNDIANANVGLCLSQTTCSENTNVFVDDGDDDDDDDIDDISYFKNEYDNNDNGENYSKYVVNDRNGEDNDEEEEDDEDDESNPPMIEWVSNHSPPCNQSLLEDVDMLLEDSRNLSW